MIVSQGYLAASLRTGTCASPEKALVLVVQMVIGWEMPEVPSDFEGLGLAKKALPEPY